MSYKPMMSTDGVVFYGNALRFATREEAEENAQDLMDRWTSVHSWMVEESDDPVNYTYHDNTLTAVNQ